MKIGYCRVSTDEQNPYLQLTALKRAGCDRIFTDKATPTGRAMWQMIGILAELEKSLIQERTKAGRVAAMARGVKMGRKPKLSPEQIKHVRQLIESGEHPRNVAKSMGCSLATLYRATGKAA